MDLKIQRLQDFLNDMSRIEALKTMLEEIISLEEYKSLDFGLRASLLSFYEHLDKHSHKVDTLKEKINNHLENINNDNY